MKKLLLLLSVFTFISSISVSQVHYQRRSQGVYELKGNGDPTGTYPKGSVYTDTASGKSWVYKDTWTREISGSTFLDIQADAGILSTGIDTGFYMTGIGASTFTVASGVGYVVSGFGPTKTITKVEYSGLSGITPTYVLNAIFINSSGVLVQRDFTTLNDSLVRDEIFLGEVAVLGGTIVVIQNTPSLNNRGISRLETLGRSIGAIKTDNVISANGANLNLDKSAGTTWRLASNYERDPTIPDITTDTSWTNIQGGQTVILYRYRDGVGGWNSQLWSGIKPDSLDDNSGSLVVVGSNKWTIQRVEFFNTTSTFLVSYGQTEYNSLALCQAGIENEDREIDPATRVSQLLCSICVKQGETSLESADTEIRNTNKFGEH